MHWRFFEQVERMKRELAKRDDLLVGLIAVFSQTAADALLYVYVDRLPENHPELAITAAQLLDVRLAPYDGPTIGLAAIDLIRPDIATKGQHFIRLDRLLRRANKVDLLRTTLADLARFLQHRLVEDPPDDEDTMARARAEIAALAAPRQLHGLTLERRQRMVAFLPDRGEVLTLDDLTPETLDDLTRQPRRATIAPDETIIAYEEVRHLIGAGGAPAPYPIELRTVLRRADLDEVETEALRELASFFHRRWEAGQDRADRERAYAAALELRLRHSDVDDLVAIVPDPDFDAFVVNGAGTYVYRRPVEGVHDEPDSRSRYLGDMVDALAHPASPVVFSLLPLRALASTGAEWFDLGPPLRKSGRTEILARNAWLLVQDLLDSARERTRLRVALDDLLETMTHCCTILSLTDPWRTRQGRRDEWLRDSYRTLLRVVDLIRHSEAGRADGYYDALSAWYGCALIETNKGLPAEEKDRQTRLALDRIVQVLSAGTGSGAGDARRARSDGERLRKVATALRQMLRGGSRVAAYEELRIPATESIPQVLRRATDMTRRTDLLSVPFGRSFREYAGLDEEIRRYRTEPIPARDKIERLTDCLERLRYRQRLIFAPHHEARILAALYTSAIDATAGLLDELTTGAAPEVSLETPSVVLEQPDSGIVFSVHNVGSVEAREVELELAASEAFELLDVTYKQSLARLGAGDSHKFRFNIRAVTDAASFPVRCTISWSHGSAGVQGPIRPEHTLNASTPTRQERTHEFVIDVVGFEVAEFRQKPNPYIFGVQITEHRHFYGRRNELRQVLGHLADNRPQNVLLRAPRRAGKTSFLHMVRSVLEDRDGRTGARRWFDVPQSWNAALDATVPVMVNLQAVEALQDNATPSDFYRAVVEALHEAGLRSQSSEDLLNEPSIRYTRFERGLRDIVHQAGGRRPVILVDEFDVVSTMADRGPFYQSLRTAITAVQGITWIIASAIGLYQEIRDYASPLFNIFRIIPLGRLDADAARQLVLGPWADSPDAGLHFAPDAVATIVEEAGYFPYFIQMLCSEVVDHVNTVHADVVQYRTVIQVIEKRMLVEGSTTDTYFDFFWDRASPVGRLLLLSLLATPSAPTYPELSSAATGLLGPGNEDLRQCVAATAEESLRQLEAVEAIRHVPGGGYAFSIPLFRRLLLRRNERFNLVEATIRDLSAASAGRR